METQNQMFEDEKYEALHGLDTTTSTEEQDEEEAKSE